MGLTGSPNTFQSLLEQVLVSMTWKTTVPYLDDCMDEEHIQRLRELLELFYSANLKINPTEEKFFRLFVPFLILLSAQWIGGRFHQNCYR